MGIADLQEGPVEQVVEGLGHRNLLYLVILDRQEQEAEEEVGVIILILGIGQAVLEDLEWLLYGVPL